MMKVTDCMNAKPASLPLDARLGDALELLRETGLRHVPVCDGDRFLGNLGLHDVEQMRSKHGQAALDRGVVGIIELGTPTLSGDESIREAWEVLSRAPGLNPLPVVRQGRLVGTVSHHELMRAMAGLPVGGGTSLHGAARTNGSTGSWLSMLVPPMQRPRTDVDVRDERPAAGDATGM